MFKLLFSFFFVCLSVARADFVDNIIDNKIADPTNENMVRLFDVNRATDTDGLPFTTRMGRGGRSDIPGVFGAGRSEGVGIGSGGARSIPSGGGSSGPSQGTFIRRIDKSQAHADRMAPKPTTQSWGVVGADKIAKHPRYGKFYRDPNTGHWWTKDLDNHGGSGWKVYKKQGAQMNWEADADPLGNYLTGKHKSPISKTINWKEFSIVKG